jgi:hypothetical protein
VTTLRDRSGQLQFVNLRAAAWWHLRERLDPASKQRPVAFPPNNDYLVEDLTAPRWAQRTSGLASGDGDFGSCSAGGWKKCSIRRSGPVSRDLSRSYRNPPSAS